MNFKRTFAIDGSSENLIAEARSSLEAANVLAPGDRRFGQQMAALDKLAR